MSTEKTEHTNHWVSSSLAATGILSVLVLFLFVPFGADAEGAESINESGAAAKVSKRAISFRDVSYRIKIEEAYGNDTVVPAVALVSLINDAVESEVALKHGVVITQDEIISYGKHVDENTKAPDILRKVKSAFGEDESSYEQIYLAPKILNRKLRYFYIRNFELHESERTLIEKAYGLVVSGMIFQEAAEKSGAKYSSFDIGDKEVAITPELQQYIPQEERGTQDPLVSILETLSIGDIYQNIVEDDYGYRVVRLKGRDGKKYSVEAIIVKKHAFDEWFKSEAAKIHIEIVDKELQREITSKYPNVWWVRKSCEK